MMLKVKRTAVAGAMVVLTVAAGVVVAADWPQFRGPGRDGVSREAGLAASWPEGGPVKLWTASGFGKGYSSVAAAGDRLYTTGLIDATEYLFALDKRGKVQWRLALGPGWTRVFPGARCTPTVAGRLIYVTTGRGLMVCVDAQTQKPKWSVDLMKTFGADVPRFGYSENVLLIGDKVIATPCGKQGTMVALDAQSGRVLWRSKALGQYSGFCSPIAFEHGGRTLIATMLAESIVCFDAADGALQWQVTYRSRHGNHPVSPIYHDGRLYATAGYRAGGVMLELSADGNSVAEAWKQRAPDTRHGGVVLLDGHIYGTDDRGEWTCVNWRSGEVVYQSKLVGAGSTIAAGGKLICFGEQGAVALVEPGGKQASVVGRFELPKPAAPSKEEGPSRRGPRTRAMYAAHPSVADGVLYLRHDDRVSAYAVAQD